jgi:hypothetical protein
MRTLFSTASLFVCLAGIPGLIALPLQSSAQQTEPAKPDSSVPDAPKTSDTPAAPTPIAAITGTAKPPAIGPMTLHERLVYAVHLNFGPGAFMLPALGAGYTMANPPHDYPRDWKDGGAALGRNYGSIFGQDTTGGLMHFATAAVDGEDPRYYPSTSTNYGRRALHAIGFTFVDKGNHGGRAFALSNFADATSAGFVGNLWEPDGFNDAAHALQRSEIQFAKLAGKNLALEFSPELTRLYQKIRPKHGSKNEPAAQDSNPNGGQR